ncbi:MAG TPA: peptidylprolyl isomerase [Acidobacteriota bacterium]|nr:peptidylprolyl isomerase [Acidobacteriota bacterium]
MRDRPIRIPYARLASEVRRIGGLYLLLMLALGGFSCRGDSADPVSDPASRQDLIPLVEVDGQVISEGEFASFVRLNGSPGTHTLSPEERLGLFENMLIDYLLDRKAQAESIEVSPAEIEEAMNRWMPQVDDTSAAQPLVGRFLKGQKLLRSRIYGDLEVSPQETRQHYNRHYKSFEAGDRVHLLEILLHDRAQAQRLREELQPGDMRAFRQAAKLHSEAAAAASEGDLGLVERGSLPAPFEEFVFSLKPGEVSPVFESGHGFHLFMVEEAIPRHQQKYYEVQKEIYVKLLAEKERRALDEFLKQMIRDASISIYDEELRSEWRKRHAETRS